MRTSRINKHLLLLVTIAIVLAPSVVAQQKRNAAPRKPAAVPAPEPALTFDSLLAAESFNVYFEIRSVGQLIHSPAVNDILDPVTKLARPPKEFNTVLKWLDVHADALAGSRVLIAAWPSRPNLPSYVAAVEFSSPEEARKFELELRPFLKKLVPPPAPTSSTPPSAAPKTSPATTADPSSTESATDLQPYSIKQSGPLVLISDTPVNPRELKPRGSKSLEEDQNFTLARNRFASESVFAYVDFRAIEKEEKERRRKWEAEEEKRLEIEARPPSVAAEVSVATQPGELVPTDSSEMPPPPPQPEPSLSTDASLGASTQQPVLVGASAPASVATVGTPAFFSLYAAFFGGETRWPEGLGISLNFEGDAYIARMLIINGPEVKGNAIPFLPQFVSGPPLASGAAAVLPADLEFFATASLDYPQMYEGMVKAMANTQEIERRYNRRRVNLAAPAVSPFAEYEQKLGLKIKDDLLPLIGNEFAVAFPRKPSPEKAVANANVPEAHTPAPDSARALEPIPILAISLKDKEGMKRVIPKLIELFGFKGANLLAQTEKRDDVEIVSYADVFSYAFIDDFLILSANSKVTRHVVDCYLNHETLSANSQYRDSSRWQPRQVLGQVYVAPDLAERYFPAQSPANDKLTEFLARLNPEIGPMTYALSDDGLGPLHELHVPQNLLQLLIASMSSEMSATPMARNETTARAILRTLVAAESTYREVKGGGRYGTLDELVAENLVDKNMFDKFGYRVELNASGTKFEATAVPVEYGKSGKLSYFIDESGVLRGGDRGGGAATSADNQIP